MLPVCRLARPRAPGLPAPPPRAGRPPGRPAALPSSAAGSAGTATQSVPGAAQSDIYLLATERSTGQPAPPEALGGQTESAMGERRGRMAIGLSGA